VPAGSGVGTAIDQVAGEDNAIHPLPGDVVECSLKGLQVAVDIGEDRQTHDLFLPS
jgi:hypothetical protein